jgi:8-oxo-dGTP diphosphatase
MVAHLLFDNRGEWLYNRAMNPTSNDSIVKVGVGVLVIKDGKVLLGKRKNAHGADEYGGPGGHLEYGETIEQTALREIGEECGITVKNLQMLCVSDLLTYFPKHYVDVGMTAEWVSGEPEVLEPHKLESWGWYDMDNLPEKLFGCVTAYVESYKTGKKYFTFPKEETK